MTKNGERDVSYSAGDWVWLELSGERPEGSGLRVRDDGGLGHELLEWCMKEDVLVHWHRTGGGFYTGRVHPGDWPRLEAWLRGRGVRSAY